MGSGRPLGLSRSPPSCLNRPAQRTDFVHGLITLRCRKLPPPLTNTYPRTPQAYAPHKVTTIAIVAAQKPPAPA